MKRLVAGRRSQIALTAALALLMVGGLSSAAQATNARSSSDLELCKNGGWQNLTTSTGATFHNQGDCVSYAATGGELFPTSSLTFTLSPCVVQAGGLTGRILRCSASIVGSGLMPDGTLDVVCSRPTFVGCGSRPVGTDGTINDTFTLFCMEGSVVSVDATTAAGNPISAGSAPCAL
jgi:hypothetical protein